MNDFTVGDQGLSQVVNAVKIRQNTAFDCFILGQLRCNGSDPTLIIISWREKRRNVYPFNFAQLLQEVLFGPAMFFGMGHGLADLDDSFFTIAQ